MAMKCTTCGMEIPEGQKFCGNCGSIISVPPPVEPTQPAPIPTKQSWLESNWKAVVAVVVVIVVVLASVGLIYTQAWSKIKVILNHSEHAQIDVNVYIDGVLKASLGVNPGTSIVGVWSVDAGTHTVQIDRGYWDVEEGYWYTITHWFSPDEIVWVPATYAYIGSDGFADFTYAYGVGPLYTKNVYIYL